MQNAPRGLAMAARTAALAAALAMAGCATRPPAVPAGAPPVSSWPDRDGPEARPPPDLDRVPDAEPRLEVVRPGGPNKPYDQSGQRYVPLAGDPPFRESGLASWYGRKFHGKPTASGELYNMYAMTAAHPTLPIPSYVRVRNPANGREVIVRVNDRGPFHSERIIDLSYTAALKLDLLRGVRQVEIERITYDDIRTGAWKRGGPEATMLAAASPAPTPPEPAPMPATVATVVAPATVTATSAAITTAALPESPAASAPIANADPARAYTADARGFWVQLGAFAKSSGALEFQRKVEHEVEGIAPLLAVFTDQRVSRLQAGPYRTRGEAASAAQKIRDALQLVPVIVERR